MTGITPDEPNSAGEQTVSFRETRSPIRLDVKGKPHCRGLKIWSRCTSSGILSDLQSMKVTGGWGGGTWWSNGVKLSYQTTTVKYSHIFVLLKKPEKMILLLNSKGKVQTFTCGNAKKERNLCYQTGKKLTGLLMRNTFTIKTQCGIHVTLYFLTVISPFCRFFAQGDSSAQGHDHDSSRGRLLHALLWPVLSVCLQTQEETSRRDSRETAWETAREEARKAARETGRATARETLL